MKVQELMSKPATTCLRNEALSSAAQKMWDQDCGALPVVDDAGRLVGMITDRDICMSAWSHGRTLDAIQVDEAMAKQVFSVKAEEDIERTEALMADKQIHRLPVTDAGGKPIGMIAMTDILREAARPGTRIKDQVTRVLQTLAEIVKPRKEPTAT